MVALADDQRDQAEGCEDEDDLHGAHPADLVGDGSKADPARQGGEGVDGDDEGRLGLRIAEHPLRERGGVGDDEQAGEGAADEDDEDEPEHGSHAHLPPVEVLRLGRRASGRRGRRSPALGRVVRGSLAQREGDEDGDREEGDAEGTHRGDDPLVVENPAGQGRHDDRGAAVGAGYEARGHSAAIREEAHRVVEGGGVGESLAEAADHAEAEDEHGARAGQPAEQPSQPPQGASGQRDELGLAAVHEVASEDHRDRRDGVEHGIGHDGVVRAEFLFQRRFKHREDVGAPGGENQQARRRQNQPPVVSNFF